jgi:hypothetical protein
MLKDISAMNPKGHVKLELYNDEGVFYTKEKKNLVVQSANEIIAHMMADPAKVLRVKQVDKGDSALSANSDLLYPFALTVQHEVKSRFENNWGAANTETEFQLDELKGITSLDEVSVGGTNLVINEDVFLVDAEQGKIRFAVAPKDNVVIRFHKVKNPYMKIIAGTEVVTVNGTPWERAAVADNETNKYQVDYRTGEILFEAPVQNVRVEYDYHMNYCLGFMALGGKPSPSHPNYQPVEFGNSNRLDTFMRNELPGSRMPIMYPAAVFNGATELEPAIPTQPIASVQKTTTIVITDIGDGSTKKLTYDLPNLHDSGSGPTGRMLLELVSVQNTTTSVDIKAGVTIPTNTLSAVNIRFADADVNIGDTVQVVYRLKLDNRHLIYQLGQSPVVKLVSVRHIDAVDNTKIKEYNIVNDGLRPNEGDVWISNPNTGHITFSENPTGGPPVHTPGQLQVEYMVNSGTVVQFIADFPKGVPAPVLEDATKVVNVVAGQTTIILDYPIAKDDTGAFIEPEVTVNGTPLTSADYTISVDGRSITPNSLSAGQVVTVNYQYEKTTHDIYQVAMFDDKTGGKMFNISGIGPVTKDQSTGMRVTWSVTF